MARIDVNASGVSSEGREKVVTVIAPKVNEGPQTGASPTPATGSRSRSDPVAASEEEHPLHVDHCTALDSPAKMQVARERAGRATPSGLLTSATMARNQPPGQGDGPTARTDPYYPGRGGPSPTPWYRKPVVLLSIVLAILIALIIWGIVALFTGNQGGAPSVTTTTVPSTTTSAPTTTPTTSGRFHLPSTITLPSLPSITLPSTITLPSLP
jgi:hypothetical protein